MIQTYGTDRQCIDSQSSTCGWDDPVFERDGIVMMETYQNSGPPSGSWSGCASVGGVIISYYSIIDDDYVEMEIPDNPEDEGRTGYRCAV